jgi:hypothetical protein
MPERKTVKQAHKEGKIKAKDLFHKDKLNRDKSEEKKER